MCGNPKQENQFAKARRLIETALANSAVSAADIEQLAEKKGISFKTFKRAKEVLALSPVNAAGCGIGRCLLMLNMRNVPQRCIRTSNISTAIAYSML